MQKYCLRTLRLYKDQLKGLDDAARDQWFAEKRSEHKARMDVGITPCGRQSAADLVNQHAALCKAWNEARSAGRSLELEDVRKRRYAAYG